MLRSLLVALLGWCVSAAHAQQVTPAPPSTVIPATSSSNGNWDFAQFNPRGDGVTDDSTAFQTALTAVASGGCGALWVGPHRYYIAGNVTVPSCVKVHCEAPLVGNTYTANWAQALTSTFLLNPAYTITMSQETAWEGCRLLQSGINFVPTTTRTEIQLVQAFAGTGLVVGGADVTIRDAAILGFAIGVSSGVSNHTARLHLVDTNIDATACVQAYKSYDPSSLRTVHCSSFLTGDSGQAREAYQITGIANNGAGLWRVTLAAATPIITGDTVWLSSCPTAGACGVNLAPQSAFGRWTATAIDTTHVDLQGSSAVGAAFTGATVSGTYSITGVPSGSFAAIGTGDAITGPGIPANTIVRFQWPRGNTIGLSNPTTATGSGTFTTTDSAFTTGSYLWLDAEQRTGVGFEFLDTATTSCFDCFTNNHYIGFHLGAGSDLQSTDWFNAAGPECDQIGTLQDQLSICILIDGASTGSTIVGGASQSVGTSIVVNSTGGEANTFDGMQLNIGSFANTNAGTAGIELDHGAVTLLGVTTPGGAPVYVASVVTQALFNGTSIINDWLCQGVAKPCGAVGAGNVTYGSAAKPAAP